jgi:hypothetical protein
MCVYRSVMGPRWDELPAAVQRAHRPSAKLRGTFEVRHGRSPLARAIARIVRCPREAAGVEVTLCIEAEDGVEWWHRTFDGRRMTTRQQSEEAGVLNERIGPLELLFRLQVEGGALRFDQVGARGRLAGLALPWPRWCRPQVEALARAEPGGVAVSVAVSLPGIGLLMSYAGRLEVPEPS